MYLLGLLVLYPQWLSAQTDYYVESDPFAFALSGYSLHVGVVQDHIHAQVGIFAADVPDALLNNTNFALTQAGYGLKLDYYPDDDSYGLFYGLEYEVMRSTYTIQTSSSEDESQLLGVRVGYKYPLTDSMYISPWMAIKHRLSDVQSVSLSGETYDIDANFFFATVHFGFDY